MKSKLMLATLITLLISGCTQDELVKSESSNGRQFTASFEQNESRTYVEDGTLLRWTAEDQISLFEGNALNQQYQFAGKTGANGGYFNKVNNTFGTGNDLGCHYAIYPYASDIEITDSGVITATLPSEQSYAENSFGLGDNTMVAVTQNVDDTFLKFKNVGGYLKLQLYGDNVTVKTITLQGNSNEKIAGTATITATYGGNPTVSMANDATETITLDCGEGVKIGTTEETATAFWIVVPPTTFESGFTITITDINDNEMTKSTSNEISIARNVINPMKAFEVETVETIPNNQIWYTSNDGNVVTPYKTDVFGATITSNTYENGKGIITFDGDVTSIGEYAFDSCELTNITIPNSVVSIGSHAFNYCAWLTSVTLPYGIKTINEKTFAYCYSLEEISIPNSVTKIGDGAFYYSNISELTIPNNVASIGLYAFGSCSLLTTVILPSSCVEILASFSSCESLSNIYLSTTTAPLIYDKDNLPDEQMIYLSAFESSIYSTCKIHVPKGSVDTYKAAYGWSNFTNIIEMED